MYLRLAAILGVLIFATVACSIVDDGRVERVNPPAELTDTLPPTTIATTTTEAATTTSGLQTTTTTVPADAVLLYYISSGKLSPIVGELSLQYAPAQLMALLQAGPIDIPINIGLRNAVPKNIEIDASQDGTGVAQVILPEGFFDNIPVGDQRLAVAQIVMTLLGNIRGVGQVAFNLQVSGPAGELIPAGQTLSRADYQTLLASSTTPANSTTTVPSTSPVPLETTTTLPV
ncbi:MAG TPA: GerMN domain-containing protein [Ilumatobacteraceae bacterium]|nr:GerMN domain-containing protein [Ilumatobacteraceae bacterium]